MSNYTPLRKTDPIMAPTVNQRFDELSEGLDDALPPVDEVTYTPAVSGYWPTVPDNVFDALEDLAGRLQYLPKKGLVSGLWLKADSVANQVEIGRGVCVSEDGEATLINSSLTTVIDITAEGINGKDAGAAAADSWYGVWLCQGSSGIGAVYSSAATADLVARPTGYDTAIRKIGTIRTDGSAVVRSQYIPPSRTDLRRVLYTEVSNASPYQMLNNANIGTSGTPTAVDFSGIVPASAVAVIALMVIATPGGACNVFWSTGSLPDSLIMTLPDVGFSFNTVRDLPVFGTQAGEIYSSAVVAEDLSLIVLGYVDSTLQEVA